MRGCTSCIVGGRPQPLIQCNFIATTFAAKLLCERKQIMTWLIASEEGFLLPGDRVSCL